MRSPMGPPNEQPAGAGSASARGFSPDARLRAEVRPPGSKSIAQRALACALLARGTTRLVGLPGSADVLAALRCARAGGARFPAGDRADDRLATAFLARGSLGAVVGAPPGPREAERPWATFPVGESGTSARLFTAIAALARPAGSGAEIAPEGSLLRRGSPALFAALRASGAGVQHAEGADAAGFSVSLTSATPPGRLELHHPTSSQEVSGLLIALAAHAGPRELFVVGAIPSRPYVDLTLRTLEAFGARVVVEELRGDGHGHGGARFSVTGPLHAPDGELAIEGDASAAAVALAAGAITGRPVRTPGVGSRSLQPDARAAREALTLAGCDLSGSDADGLALTGRASRPLEFDCGGSPDLAPPLAAVAAYLARAHGHRSHLTGLETLPGKESSRIEVLARGLREIGLRAEARDGVALVVAPGDGDPAEGEGDAREVTLDPAGDHRMAFAFALLSLFEPGVRVRDPGCVAKSWPGFWSDLVEAP